MEMIGEPLPGMPEPPPAREPAARPGFHRYSGPHRLCDGCVRNLHEKGVARAPFPRPVRWVHVPEDGSVPDYLCQPCKEAER